MPGCSCVDGEIEVLKSGDGIHLIGRVITVLKDHGHAADEFLEQISMEEIGQVGIMTNFLTHHNASLNPNVFRDFAGRKSMKINPVIYLRTDLWDASPSGGEWGSSLQSGNFSGIG
jgi:hypothetical protein